MRVIIQRVSEACVYMPELEETRSVGKGLLILLGIEETDSEEDADWLVRKIASIRIFSDEQGKMNLGIQDIHGEVLLISQFTLHASTKKGNRPSFIKAARPEQAIPLYESFARKLGDEGIPYKTGVFGADMKVSLINDGPVTIFIDSKAKE